MKIKLNDIFCIVNGDFKYGVAGIYEFHCWENNTFYVGSSTNMRRRILSHVRDLNGNRHINRYFQNTWTKYGAKSFEIKLLERVEDVDNLINKEKQWIDTLLGSGNKLLNVELDPKDKSGSNNPFYGKSHSDKTKIALSQSHRKVSKNHLRSILTLINSGIVKSREIAKRFGVSESTISEIKSKKRKYIDVEEYPCVIVTGSQGFICGYLVKELIDRGYFVFGIDNYSKYGKVLRSHDSNENFWLIEQDLTKSPVPYIANAQYIIAAAARIGGISYFSKFPRYIMRDNELILANTFDTALELFQNESLKRIIIISSSMVYEGADVANKNLFETSEFWPPWPTPEGAEKVFGPPTSVYGFQKLASEYWAKAYWEQDRLPYTILRPFNCVGIGEDEAIGEEEVFSGNVKLRMSHVVPDIINKCLQGQNPLHLLGDGQQVRCYTHGKDIARGIRMAMESSRAMNEDYNISNARPTTVLELATLIWRRINPDKPFRWVSDEPYQCDVQKRLPDVSKARDDFAFEANILLETSIDEVIESMRSE